MGSVNENNANGGLSKHLCTEDTPLIARVDRMMEEINENVTECGLTEVDDDDDDNDGSYEHILHKNRNSNVPRLFCAILAAITTGGTYAFSVYGEELKRNLHLTQSQLDTISSAAFLAGVTSSVPGLIVDRMGVRAGMVSGGASGALFLVCYWAVAKGYILSEYAADPSIPGSTSSEVIVIALSSLGFLIFSSSSIITGSVFKTILTNCGPGTKGSAVGAGKAYVGLGAGTYNLIFQAIRSPSSSDLDFLLLVAVFFITMAVVPSWLLLPTKKNEMNGLNETCDNVGTANLTTSGVRDVTTNLHYRQVHLSLFSLMAMISWRSLSVLFNGRKVGDDDHLHPNYVLGGFIMIVWVGPIVSFLFMPHSRDDDGLDEPNLELEPCHETILSVEDGSVNSKSTSISHQPESCIDEQAFDGNKGPILIDEPSYTLLEMLSTSTAWYLFWTVVILVGNGTVLTNNLGQMVESLGFHKSATPSCIGLFSVAQSLGRVTTGTISEMALTTTSFRGIGNSFIFFTNSGGIRRPVFLIVASLGCALAHGMLALSSSLAPFVLGIILSGLAFGMCWPLMVLIVGEVFGMKHMAANYMFYDGISLAGGTLLLSKFVAQEVYELNIEPNDVGESEHTTCYGMKCFQMTHVISAALSLTCVVASILILYSSRRLESRRTIPNDS